MKKIQSKKMLLGLGSLVAVATPIVAVVSCGDDDKKTEESKTEESAGAEGTGTGSTSTGGSTGTGSTSTGGAGSSVEFSEGTGFASQTWLETDLDTNSHGFSIPKTTFKVDGESVPTDYTYALNIADDYQTADTLGSFIARPGLTNNLVTTGAGEHDKAVADSQLAELRTFIGEALARGSRLLVTERVSGYSEDRFVSIGDNGGYEWFVLEVNGYSEAPDAPAASVAAGSIWTSADGHSDGSRYGFWVPMPGWTVGGVPVGQQYTKMFNPTGDYETANKLGESFAFENSMNSLYVTGGVGYDMNVAPEHLQEVRDFIGAVIGRGHRLILTERVTAFDQDHYVTVGPDPKHADFTWYLAEVDGGGATGAPAGGSTGGSSSYDSDNGEDSGSGGYSSSYGSGSGGSGSDAEPQGDAAVSEDEAAKQVYDNTLAATNDLVSRMTDELATLNTDAKPTVPAELAASSDAAAYEAGTEALKSVQAEIRAWLTKAQEAQASASLASLTGQLVFADNINFANFNPTQEHVSNIRSLTRGQNYVAPITMADDLTIGSTTLTPAQQMTAAGATLAADGSVESGSVAVEMDEFLSNLIKLLPEADRTQANLLHLLDNLMPVSTAHAGLNIKLGTTTIKNGHIYYKGNDYASSEAFLNDWMINYSGADKALTQADIDAAAAEAQAAAAAIAATKTPVTRPAAPTVNGHDIEGIKQQWLPTEGVAVHVTDATGTEITSFTGLAAGAYTVTYVLTIADTIWADDDSHEDFSTTLTVVDAPAADATSTVDPNAGTTATGSGATASLLSIYA